MVDAYGGLLASLGDYVLHKFPHLGPQDRMVMLGLEARLRRGVAAALVASTPLSLPGAPACLLDGYVCKPAGPAQHLSVRVPSISVSGERK